MADYECKHCGWMTGWLRREVALAAFKEHLRKVHNIHV